MTPNDVPNDPPRIGSEAFDRLPEGWETLTHWSRPGAEGYLLGHTDGRVVRVQIVPEADDRTSDELAELLDGLPCIIDDHVLPRIYADVMGGE